MAGTLLELPECVDETVGQQLREILPLLIGEASELVAIKQPGTLGT